MISILISPFVCTPREGHRSTGLKHNFGDSFNCVRQ